MKSTLLRTVVRPLVERVGTMLAAYMIARGVDSDLAAQMVNALVAALAILLDLVTASVNRQKLVGEMIESRPAWPRSIEPQFPPRED